MNAAFMFPRAHFVNVLQYFINHIQDQCNMWVKSIKTSFEFVEKLSNFDEDVS